MWMRGFDDLEEPARCFPAQLINWSGFNRKWKKIGNESPSQMACGDITPQTNWRHAESL